MALRRWDPSPQQGAGFGGAALYAREVDDTFVWLTGVH